MKAATLHGAAIAVALIVGVQLPAQEGSAGGKSCPWITKHAAAMEWEPAQPAAGDLQAAEDAVPTQSAPHPLKTVDCSGGGWQKFIAPGFDTQEACVGWVLEYLRPKMLEKLPPGEAREFDFPQSETGSGAILRTGAPLLI